MRLLHVIASTNPEDGGPIEGVLQTAGVLAEVGVRVEIASCDPPNAPWLGAIAAPVFALGPGISFYCYAPRLLPWLRANAANYDAVIVNGLWRYSDFAVWRALHGTTTPYFVFTHGMLDPWFRHNYRLKHMKKWMYWPWAQYRVLRDARAVLFTCQEERLRASQSFWLYRANEAVTRYGTSRPPSGDGSTFFSAYPRLRSKRIVLFLSRLHEKKGCDILLDAFAMVADLDESVHLVMAGPDPTGLAASLHARAKRLGIYQRVTWPGMLRGDLKWGAFRAAEIFCLPSHHENFGIVVAEALGCGTPVLISDKVHIWREIADDAAGFVDEDTVQGTVRNLRRWLGCDRTDMARLSTRARQCFESRFEIHLAAERLLTIFRWYGV
jgi:glycosyltransferase involved in cell wall biosynthesis